MDSPSSRSISTRNTRLLLELGQGGMGTVYLAVSEGPGGFSKLKVIKRLRSDLGADDQFARMFLDEARLAARLNHPNVVQTNEVGFDGHHYFMEMEYLEGQSLEAVTRRAERIGGLPLATGLWILTQTLAGLHYAHELTDTKGRPFHVVHRDVSPHNIHVTYDGAVKVLDFGIAKAADSSAETRTGAVKGKITYMSPEQSGRRPVDRRADLFAVGIILWQMLTEERLWRNLSDLDILERLRDAKIPTPRSVKEDVPEELDTVCMRALAANPEDRYATAAEMQLALEDYLDRHEGKVGVRPVAELMTKLFADRRAAIREEIDVRLHEASTQKDSGRGEVTVPALRELEGLRETFTDLQTRAPRPASEEERTHAEGQRARSGGESAVEETSNRALLTRIDARDAPRASSRTTIAVLALAALVAASIVLERWRASTRGPVAGASVAPKACRAASDCRTLGPRFLCTEKGTCVAAAECIANAECSARSGKPSFCRKDEGTCAPMETIDCRVIAEPDAPDNDRTLWLGTMFPTTGPAAEEVGKPNERGVVVAWQDVKTLTRGLPSLDGVLPPRPIGLVSCDDARDPNAAARHLVNDLQIPVVFGFSKTQELVDLATTLFIPTGTMAVSVMNPSPLVATIPHPPNTPRLVWRTTLSDGFLAESLSRLVPQVVEPKLRATGVVKPSEPMRVALIRFEGARGMSTAQVFTRSLQFNGKAALENEHSFEEFVLLDSESNERDAEIVAALARLSPHVVLTPDGGEIIRRLLLPLEQRWSSKEPRPVYLSLSTVGGADLDAALVKIPSLQGRFFGVYSPSKTPTNLRFTMRYNEDEPVGKKTDYTMTPSQSYDGLYAVVYAIYRAQMEGDSKTTGVSVANAMTNLSSGQAIDVGGADLLAGFAALKRDRRIDLMGAASAMNFDPATGDVASDLVIQCVRKLGRAKVNEPLETDLRYSAARERWEGPFECASGSGGRSGELGAGVK